ncbi:MAG TPA: 2-hydroxyacid dehydrogenase [Burkholderiaceae bacterium]|nr:2-hydroxyacid dehydrogenase [Burkholderiaceae bacterium]
MKPRIIQVGRLQASLEKALAAEFDTHPLWRERDPAAFLAQHGGQFAGMATSVRSGVDARMMDALPALRVIANFGVGYETIDVEAAKRRAIAVSNTPDVLTDCVADLAIGLMIDVARGISAADRFVRRGDWTRAQFPLATRVSGKRLGILGLGRIGAAIARRAEGFGMQIRYHSRRPVGGVPYGHAASLVELAEWTDFLIIAAAGGAATRHLVSTEVIDALGPRGFLVNVARGSVVDETALVRALGEKRIAGAGLDVFVDEPNVPLALLELDNVVLLPHIASATRETRNAMGDLVIENLRAFFATGRVKTPVA